MARRAQTPVYNSCILQMIPPSCARVWVAQLPQGPAEPTLAIVSFDRPPSSAASQNSPALVLHATTLMSQPEPILDAAVIEGSPRRMLLLSSAAISIFDWKDGKWLL